MSVWTSTPTQKGLALQSKLLSTDKLEITRVVSGAGSVSVGQLSVQTAISDIKQELTVESLTYDENGTGLLRVMINNYALQTGYSMKQIGIYANDPDEGEILYVIAQVTDVAENIPSITEQPAGFTCGWAFRLAFSNSSNISITISPDAFITSATADLRYSAKDHSHSDFAKTEDLVGKNLEGKEVSPTYGTTETAAVGAEIFNDYAERKYASDNQTVSQGNVARGMYSHAEGSGTTASGNSAHAEGYRTVASGAQAHAEGYGTTASGMQAHAEGSGTVASGMQSHAEGLDTTASGRYSHAEGYGTTASGWYAHTEGNGTTASGHYSHAEGYFTRAAGDYSHSQGNFTQAAGEYAFVGGQYNIANANQTVFGKYADTSGSTDKGGVDSVSATTGSLFIVGNGTGEDARTNVFRASASGRCYGSQAFGSSGADYAEFFEWLDGNPDNEDRRGIFVTLDGEYIRVATNEDDFILGVISATPSVIGDVHSESWKDMYLRDVFGERITEVVTVPESVDEGTGKTIPEHTETRWILNPEYDSSKGYLSRDERQEWAAVGLMGKLIVSDDGTCKVNGYCSVSSNGTATASDTGYRVMKRIDDTHIKILFR